MFVSQIWPKPQRHYAVRQYKRTILLLLLNRSLKRQTDKDPAENRSDESVWECLIMIKKMCVKELAYPDT